MKFSLKVIAVGAMATLMVCSSKAEAPAPKAQQAGKQNAPAKAGKKMQAPPPRNKGHRMLLEPVKAEKFSDAPKAKNVAGKDGAAAGSK
jgi:hypothetical protein